MIRRTILRRHIARLKAARTQAKRSGHGALAAKAKRQIETLRGLVG